MGIKKRTGSIDLEEVRTIDINPVVDNFSIHLFSDDISDDTSFTLEWSGDGTNWSTAQESGVDVSETLSSGSAFVNSYEVDAGMNLRINFGGSTTGNVSYIIW